MCRPCSCSDLNTSDIDLNADYSDDDTRIYFDDKKLIEHLQKLEENNLFKMNLLQENQQTFEKMELESQQTLAAKRLKI